VKVCPIDLVLTEVEDRPEQPGLEQFTLIFRGPRERLLPQMMCQLKHPDMDPLVLFLIPTISRDQEYYYYQVCFGRLTG
jgi:hypothetical protein